MSTPKSTKLYDKYGRAGVAGQFSEEGQLLLAGLLPWPGPERHIRRHVRVGVRESSSMPSSAAASRADRARGRTSGLDIEIEPGGCGQGRETGDRRADVREVRPVQWDRFAWTARATHVQTCGGKGQVQRVATPGQRPVHHDGHLPQVRRQRQADRAIPCPKCDGERVHP